MRGRGALLITVVTAAVTLAACGRATEDQINQALGITPTPTPSSEEIASSTAAAAASATARALAAASPDAAAGALALGDVRSGSRVFQTWCSGCHLPGGQGPPLLEPGGPGSAVTYEELLALIREGAGHDPPGAYPTTTITDKQVADIGAYILSEAGS